MSSKESVMNEWKKRTQTLQINCSYWWLWVCEWSKHWEILTVHHNQANGRAKSSRSDAAGHWQSGWHVSCIVSHRLLFTWLRSVSSAVSFAKSYLIDLDVIWYVCHICCINHVSPNICHHCVYNLIKLQHVIVESLYDLSPSWEVKMEKIICNTEPNWL